MIVFAAILIVAAPTTFAAEAKPGGFYIGGSVGTSEFDDDDFFDDVGLDLDDSDTAYGILGGYKFNKNFAVEARYTETGDFEVSDCCNSVDIETDILSAHLVGIIPFATGWSIYGQIGIGQVNAEIEGDDEDETVVSAGLGVSYNPIEPLSFAFQVDAYGWEEEGPFDDYDVTIATAQFVVRYTF
jgi:OOP family OmpA-OmpF porin